MMGEQKVGFTNSKKKFENLFFRKLDLQIPKKNLRICFSECWISKFPKKFPKFFSKCFGDFQKMLSWTCFQCGYVQIETFGAFLKKISKTRNWRILAIFYNRVFQALKNTFLKNQKKSSRNTRRYRKILAILFIMFIGRFFSKFRKTLKNAFEARVPSMVIF